MMNNIKKCFLWVGFFLITMTLAKQSFSENLIAPNEGFSAQEVVEIQLLGLQSGASGQGIEQVWLFAHPNNKRATGPLARFKMLFETPSYSPLLNLQSYSIKLVNATDIESQFVVSIITGDGISYDYFWAVEKVLSGEQVGFWMTTMVSSPRQLSRAS